MAGASRVCGTVRAAALDSGDSGVTGTKLGLRELSPVAGSPASAPQSSIASPRLASSLRGQGHTPPPALPPASQVLHPPSSVCPQTPRRPSRHSFRNAGTVFHVFHDRQWNSGRGPSAPGRMNKMRSCHTLECPLAIRRDRHVANRTWHTDPNEEGPRGPACDQVCMKGPDGAVRRRSPGPLGPAAAEGHGVSSGSGETF